MFFKNLRLFRLVKPMALDAEALEEALPRRAFAPCQSQQPESWGFVSPLPEAGEDAPWVHASGGRLLVCVKHEQKILPAAAVNELLAARAEEIEARDGQALSRKQRQLLKDELILEMLPRAFSRSRKHFAYLDAAAGWLLVDAAAANLAEQVVALLREALGSMPVKPAASASPMASLLTAWVESGVVGDATDFVIEDECELRDPESGGAVARLAKHDLSGDEVRVHLDSGKQVTKLALAFDERLRFVLDEQFGIKRLKFSDAVLDELDDVAMEDARARFDADFALMSAEFSRLVERLAAVAGVDMDLE